MRIAIGADHAGFALKEIIARDLDVHGHVVIDKGTFNEEPVDYPDFAEAVGRSVASAEAERGVLVCGSGVGASVTANMLDFLFSRGLVSSVAKTTTTRVPDQEDTAGVSVAHRALVLKL